MGSSGGASNKAFWGHTFSLCGDYKVSGNLHLEVNKHPLPNPKEIFTALNGGEKSTKLDLLEAYLQIPLDEQSRNLVVINTHKGFYHFIRLPNGVASAPTNYGSNFTQTRRNYLLHT